MICDSNTPPKRIALDFRWLDQLTICNGQFRYVVDLIRGLAAMSSSYHFVVLGSRPTPADDIATVFEDGEHWRYCYLPHSTGRGAFWREQLRYQLLLRHLQIDLLHALHTFIPFFSPAPVVATVYDMMLEIFPEYSAIVRSREYRLYKWALQHSASRAIAISRTTAEDLQRLWSYPSERTDVVYLGSHFPSRATLPLVRAQGSDVPMILAPYNLEPRKNLVRLLEAVAQLRSQGVQFQLVLFGRAAVTEDRERAFQLQLQELGLGSCANLTGRVSDEKLDELYRRASVFVFPSLYEGFGLPVLEAMSAGACVVAHNESAMAEVVADTGLLVNMRSTQAISEAIFSALSSPYDRARAIQRARSFTREFMAAETLKVFEKALNPRRSDIPISDSQLPSQRTIARPMALATDQSVHPTKGS